MIKLKRLISGFIDYAVTYLIINIFYSELLIYSLEKNKILEMIFTILFIILGSFILCSKEILLNGTTIGKKLTKSYIIDSENPFEKLDETKLFLRNLLTLITMPVSIISIILFNKSIGDFILKTKVVSGNENRKISIDITKKAIFTKIIIFFTLLIAISSIIVLVFFQKINYNSLDFVSSLIQLIIILLIFKLLKKKTKKAKIMYMVISYIIIFCISSEINTYIEGRVANFDNVVDSFHYSYPRCEIIKKYEFDDYAFIVYEEEGDNFNSYEIIHYLKKDNVWEIIPQRLNKQTKLGIYSEVSVNGAHTSVDSLRIKYNKIDNFEKSVILIISNMYIPVEEISDIYDSEFEEIKARNEYAYLSLVNGKLDNNYKIKVKNNEYNLKF